MSKEHTPLRYDHVGSFLCPAKLKQARLDFQAGKIDAAALKAVEDEAIVDLVHKHWSAFPRGSGDDRRYLPNR